MAFIQPLDLKYWLINTLSGSAEIFIFLSYIFIAVMAAKFRMNGFITLMMIGLYTVIMSQYIGGIYMLICVLAGLVSFVAISRVTKS
jgi:hypothetical protein